MSYQFAKAFKPLRIGFVNNMPDGAFLATEQQFAGLVSKATGGEVPLELFHLPSLTRGPEALKHMEGRYRPIEALYLQGIDALIVTGNEPRTPRLNEEVYWPEMTQLIDWAKDNTASTLWSCLAAHAAVLHLDGIERKRLPAKRSGVYAYQVEPMFDALPNELTLCHSRLNDIPRLALLNANYQILSGNSEGQVDSFTKSWPSKFLFLQGHPEYDVGSLGREYRRDIERYLKGQRDDYPSIPENYFDAEAIRPLAAFQMKAEETRDPSLANEFPSVAPRQDLSATLQNSASAIYDFWIKTIGEKVKTSATI